MHLVGGEKLCFVALCWLKIHGGGLTVEQLFSFLTAVKKVVRHSHFFQFSTKLMYNLEVLYLSIPFSANLYFYS